MANIPAALAVLETHLVAAGGALTDPLLDVDRGLPIGGRQLRYYWGGEVDPPAFDGQRDLTGEIVGQRIVIVATWPLQDLDVESVTAIDVEMQLLAGQVRTRILGDSQLGGNVVDLVLEFAEPDVVIIGNARHVALTWLLDLSYVEYAVSA